MPKPVNPADPHPPVFIYFVDAISFSRFLTWLPIAPLWVLGWGVGVGPRGGLCASRPGRGLLPLQLFLLGGREPGLSVPRLGLGLVLAAGRAWSAVAAVVIRV